MPRATIDPALGLRVISVRELRYDTGAALGDDRPAHVRAASGLAFVGGRLAVIQDDAAFIAFVGADVSAVALPRGAGGRRRFEVGIGNKMEKLDLEACVAVGDELWAFGSGSAPAREKIAVLGYTTRLHDAAPLFRRLREEVSGPSAADSFRAPPAVNIEGACLVGEELWLLHRGNTGPHDRGPMVFTLPKAAFARWLASEDALPEVTNAIAYDLGAGGGIRLGFTDAVAVGARVFYLAAAEASGNAIDDGRVVASQLGVIAGESVRACELMIDGAPVKAEGLAFDPRDPMHAWLAIDPDNVDEPARLYEIELVGPW
ncbi:MAG TPA: hypothetical protein VIV40_18475 [Kofleriaceae bacterium]